MGELSVQAYVERKVYPRWLPQHLQDFVATVISLLCFPIIVPSKLLCLAQNF